MLDADLRQRQREMVQREAEQNASAEGLPLPRDLERLETRIDDQRNRLRGEPDTSTTAWRSRRADRPTALRHACRPPTISASPRRGGELATLAASECSTEPEARADALQASIRTWQGQSQFGCRCTTGGQRGGRTDPAGVVRGSKSAAGGLEESLEPAQVQVRRGDRSRRQANARPRRHGRS